MRPLGEANIRSQTVPRGQSAGQHWAISPQAHGRRNRCAFRRPLSGVKIRNAGGRRLPAEACLPDDRGACRQQTERGGCTLTRSRGFLAHAPTSVFPRLLPSLSILLKSPTPAALDALFRRFDPASVSLPLRPRLPRLWGLVRQCVALSYFPLWFVPAACVQSRSDSGIIGKISLAFAAAASTSLPAACVPCFRVQIGFRKQGQGVRISASVRDAPVREQGRSRGESPVCKYQCGASGRAPVPADCGEIVFRATFRITHLHALDDFPFEARVCALSTARRKRFVRQFRDSPATWMLAQRNVYGYL